jgi:hypothetical protein
MNNVILPIFWWWLETSWVNWVDLSHVLFSNLSILSVGVIIFVWVMEIHKIIILVSVFHYQWFLHLMRHIILPIFRWRLETSWMSWIDLCKRMV